MIIQSEAGQFAAGIINKYKHFGISTFPNPELVYREESAGTNVSLQNINHLLHTKLDFIFKTYQYNEMPAIWNRELLQTVICHALPGVKEKAIRQIENHFKPERAIRIADHVNSWTTEERKQFIRLIRETYGKESEAEIQRLLLKEHKISETQIHRILSELEIIYPHQIHWLLRRTEAETVPENFTAEHGLGRETDLVITKRGLGRGMDSVIAKRGLGREMDLVTTKRDISYETAHMTDSILSLRNRIKINTKQLKVRNADITHRSLQDITYEQSDNMRSLQAHTEKGFSGQADSRAGMEMQLLRQNLQSKPELPLVQKAMKSLPEPALIQKVTQTLPEAPSEQTATQFPSNPPMVQRIPQKPEESVAIRRTMQPRTEPFSVQEPMQPRLEPLSIQQPMQPRPEPLSIQQPMQTWTEPLSVQQPVQFRTEPSLFQRTAPDLPQSPLLQNASRQNAQNSVVPTSSLYFPRTFSGIEISSRNILVSSFKEGREQEIHLRRAEKNLPVISSTDLHQEPLNYANIQDDPNSSAAWNTRAVRSAELYHQPAREKNELEPMVKELHQLEKRITVQEKIVTKMSQEKSETETGKFAGKTVADLTGQVMKTLDHEMRLERMKRGLL